MRSWLVYFVAVIAVASGTAQTNEATNGQSSQGIPHSSAPGEKENTSDSTAIEAIRRVGPAYPLAAVNKKIHGLVVIKASVSPQGDVTGAQVERGDPVLAQAAAHAAKDWKFKPVIRNGVAESFSTSLPFNFIYQDKDTDALPADPLTTDAMQVVWVAGGLAQKHLTNHVWPRYPREAMATKTQGAVNFFAAIGADGTIRQLLLLQGNPLLAQEARDAVIQWHYRPFILGGAPVGVQTMITVNFTFSGG